MTAKRLNELIRQAQGLSLINWDGLVAQIRNIKQWKNFTESEGDEYHKRCISLIYGLKKMMVEEFDGYGLNKERQEIARVDAEDIYYMADELSAETNFRNLKERKYFTKW